MQPLGLKSRDLWTYHAHLRSTHDFQIGVEVQRMDHRPLTRIEPIMIDGQINVQTGDAVGRTATFTFYDPDRSMQLDAGSPWAGGIFADRMIEVTHTTTVPGVGPVTAVPFVGPVVKVSRDQDTLSVECQDKTAIALTGSRPFKVKKGLNAVTAIRRILRQCTGETRFRLPSGNKRQLPRAYNVGWSEEAAPWRVCQKIAKNVLGMDLFYSCDGYATLRRRPSSHALTITAAQLTSAVKADLDVSSVKNRVIVRAKVARKVKAKNKKGTVTKTTKVSATAQAGKNHPLAPGRLGRNGVPRFLPLVDKGQTFKKSKQAQQRANRLLKRNLPMTVDASFDMVPVFHLDALDSLRVQTDAGNITVRLLTASIPLGVSGDMSIGQQKRVARGRRA